MLQGGLSITITVSLSACTQKRCLGGLLDSESSVARQHKGLVDVGVLLQGKRYKEKESDEVQFEGLSNTRQTHTAVYTPEARRTALTCGTEQYKMPRGILPVA